MKLEIIGGILGAALLLGLGLVIRDWKHKADLLPVVQKSFDDYKTRAEDNEKHRDKIIKELVKEKGDLALVRSAPAPHTVRLCVRPASVSTAANSTVGDSSAGPAAGVLPEEVGRDIESQITRLIDEADDWNLVLRSCQSFIHRD